MTLDALLTLSNNQSLALAAPGAPSDGTIDLAGAGGPGNAPQGFFGTATVFGEDIGVGSGRDAPKLIVQVGTGFATGNAGTLRVQLQESVDSGPPDYTASAWTTIDQTDDLTPAQLVAGAQIAEFTWPVRAPGQLPPRFLRLNYLVTNTMTAGTIAYAGIALGRDDTPMYPAAY